MPGPIPLPKSPKAAGPGQAPAAPNARATVSKAPPKPAGTSAAGKAPPPPPKPAQQAGAARGKGAVAAGSATGNVAGQASGPLPPAQPQGDVINLPFGTDAKGNDNTGPKPGRKINLPFGTDAKGNDMIGGLNPPPPPPPPPPPLPGGHEGIDHLQKQLDQINAGHRRKISIADLQE